MPKLHKRHRVVIAFAASLPALGAQTWGSVSRAAGSLGYGHRTFIGVGLPFVYAPSINAVRTRIEAAPRSRDPLEQHKER